MAPDDGAFFVQLQIQSGNAQGFCKNAAWSFSSVVYYLVDHLTVMRRKYFILNKKDQVCVQTLVYDDKTLILHRMEDVDQSTGKM